MKNFLRRLSVLTLVAAMLVSALPLNGSAATEYPKSFEAVADGIDCHTSTGNLIIYPNKTDSVRSIKADEYNFEPVKLMVFDASGKLIEVGKNLIVHSEGKTNSPQEYLHIPAGGFAIAFKGGADNHFNAIFEWALEGGMIYNATLSVLYDAKAEYDEATKKVTVYYTNKGSASGAKRFLFVGNSATYFNGTPIKFKGLAEAAGVKTYISYCTYGAAKLYEFADENHDRGKAFRRAVQTTKYDYVILQDAGAATYETSYPAVETLVPIIKKSGATPVLYGRYSDKKDPSEREGDSKVKYESYTKLSEDFDIVASPVMEAFVICTNKYPEINLYADDKSHHSKEGSYLAAAVWLYSYLGIDPRGNTYDAQMDEQTVKALQECAYEAAAVGYFNPKVSEDESSVADNTESSAESVESVAYEATSDTVGNETEGGDSTWIYIVIAAAAVIIIAVIVVIAAKKKK